MPRLHKIPYRNPYHRGDMDVTSHGQIVIEPLHAEIHQGEGFSFFQPFEEILMNEFGDILIETNKKEMHTTFRSFFDPTAGPIFHQLYENPIIQEDSTGFLKGIEIQAKNRNRSHILPSVSKIYHSPTIFQESSGTPVSAELLSHCGLYGDSSNRVFAAEDAQHDEWILAANTLYLIRIFDGNKKIRDLTFASSFYEVLPLESKEDE